MLRLSGCEESVRSDSYSVGPIAMVQNLFAQKRLLVSMVRRDISIRYRGSFIGIAWSLIIPLLMLVVYTAVFGGIFKARWGGDGSTTQFALQLFCGLTLHGLLGDCLSRAPAKVLEHANYVKKVVFPLEILPVIVVSSSLFHALLSIVILLLAVVFVGDGLHWPALCLPLVLLPFLLLCLGVSWFLAATTVYVRDLVHVTSLLSTLLLFLSPIFYPIEMIPTMFRGVMMFNPLTIPVEQLRSVLISGHWPNWGLLGLYTGVSMLLAWLGYAWFQKARKGFADVL